MKLKYPLLSSSLLVIAVLLSGHSASGQTTYLWTNTAAGNNWNVNANWAPKGAPGTVDSAVFATNGTSATAGTIGNIVNANTSVANLQYTNFGNNFHVTQIPTNVTLTVTNTVRIGDLGAAWAGANSNRVVFTGAGTFVATAPTFNIAGSGAATSSSRSNLFDMSGLSNFVYISSAGTIAVGAGDRTVGEVRLAASSNYITAATYNQIWPTSSSTSALIGNLLLGSGTNIFNVNNFNMARGRNTVTVGFSGASGGLKMRGVGGTDTDRANMQIGLKDQNGTSVTNSGSMVLVGHPVDMKLATVSIGQATAGNNTFTAANGLFNFNNGTVDATTINLAILSGANAISNVVTGSFTVGTGGTLVAGDISLVNSSITPITNAAGSLFIGGSATVTGNITKTTSVGTGAVTITNGTLTMTSGKSVGTPAIPVDAMNSTNATLHLALSAASQVTNVVATTLNLGTNTIIIDSFNGVSTPVTFKLFSYATRNLAGAFANSLTVSVPPGFSYGLVDNVAAKTVDLVVTNTLPIIGNLSASQAIAFGTTSISLTGNVATLSGQYPTNGESGTVSATINETTVTGSFTDAVGNFSITFPTATIPVAQFAPYTITYSYTGNGILLAAANDSTKTLTVYDPASAFNWTGSSNPTLTWSTPGNWSPTVTPGSTADARFFNTGSIASAGVALSNNIVASSITVRSLVYGQTNGYHNTLINSGVTLTVSNAVGTNLLVAGTESEGGASLQVTNTISGSGVLTVFNTNVDSQVIIRQSSTSSGTHRTTLDMSGLDTFNATAGSVLVGVQSATIPRPAATWLLAKTNYITATGAGSTNTTTVGGPTPAIDIADGNNNGGVAIVQLGLTNVVFADSFAVCRQKSTATLQFNPNFTNSNPVFYLRGQSSTRVTNFSVADFSAQNGSGSATAGTVDLTGGTLDAKVNELYIARGQFGFGAGALTGTFTYGAGTLDVNNLEIGYQTTNIAGAVATGTMNVNSSASLVVNTSLRLGRNVNGTTNLPSGTLNINGGSVNAKSIATESTSTTISMIGGSLAVTNTIGAVGAPLGTLSMSNSTLTLSAVHGVNGATVNTLTTAGTTTNYINVVPAITNYPAQITLIKYATLNAYAFELGTFPTASPAFVGYLSNNVANNSVDLVLTDGPIATSLTLNSSSSVIGYNSGVTFTANVAPSSATGDVTFKTNGVTHSTVTLAGGSASTVSIANLPRGTNVITAEYSGVGSYLGSTNSLNQIVTNHAPVASTIIMGAVSGIASTAKVVAGKYPPTDVDGDSLTVSAVSYTSGNGASVSTDGTNVTYTASASYNGSDSFTYTVFDGFGGSVTATVNVAVATAGEGYNKISGPTALGGGDFQLTYAGVPGYQYALDWTTSLTPPISWVPQTTNTAGANGLLNFTNNQTGSPNFWRTRYIP